MESSPARRPGGSPRSLSTSPILPPIQQSSAPQSSENAVSRSDLAADLTFGNEAEDLFPSFSFDGLGDDFSLPDDQLAALNASISQFEQWGVEKSMVLQSTPLQTHPGEAAGSHPAGFPSGSSQDVFAGGSIEQDVMTGSVLEKGIGDVLRAGDENSEYQVGRKASNAKDDDAPVGQPVWSSMLSTPDQARYWLAANLKEPRKVQSTAGEVATQRLFHAAHAKDLFDEICSDPPSAPTDWTAKQQTYYDSQQGAAVAGIKALLSTKGGCMRAQSHCILAIEQAFLLHGPGIAATKNKGVKVDETLDLTTRIKRIIGCTQIKRIGEAILSGKRDTIDDLVQNPKSMFTGRMHFMKNNSNKKDNANAGKHARKKPVDASDGRDILASNVVTPAGSSAYTPSSRSSGTLPGDPHFAQHTHSTGLKRHREVGENVSDPSSFYSPPKTVRRSGTFTQYQPATSNFFPSTQGLDWQQQSTRGNHFSQPPAYTQPQDSAFPTDFQSQYARPAFSRTEYQPAPSAVPLELGYQNHQMIGTLSDTHLAQGQLQQYTQSQVRGQGLSGYDLQATNIDTDISSTTTHHETRDTYDQQNNAQNRSAR